MVFPSDKYVSIRCLDPEMVWNKGGGGCGMGCNIYKAYTLKKFRCDGHPNCVVLLWQLRN